MSPGWHLFAVRWAFTLWAVRLAPNIVVRESSPNQSSRNGAKVKLLVVHATEAPRTPSSDADLRSLAGWFASTSSQVSSHVATNGRGNSARFVPDAAKAWHVAGYNAVALGVEQVGHTADVTWPDAELWETARWLAQWSHDRGIPLRHGRVFRGIVLRRGVVRHSDLGVLGGNHDDPGAGYPLALVIDRAKSIRKSRYGA